MSDDGWAFEEEIDLWDDDPTSTDLPAAEEPGLTGQDPDAVVTVTVDATGAIQRIRLASGWKTMVDPRALHSCVMTAVETATIRAVAEQATRIDQTPPQPQQSPFDIDESPLTAQDVIRLEEAVAGELRHFSAQIAAASALHESAESAGGHVRGSAKNGRLLTLSIAPDWSAYARSTEIESELVDVLGKLLNIDHQPTPQGPAFNELMSLLHDPARLLRRVGLPAPTRENQR